MKKIITVLFLAVLSFGLVACGGSVDFEAMKEDLEDKGFDISVVPMGDDLYGVRIYNQPDQEFLYITSDDEIAIIVFGYDDDHGYVYADNEDLEVLFNIEGLDDDFIEPYKDALKDIGYSEKQMKDFTIWLLDENN